MPTEIKGRGLGLMTQIDFSMIRVGACTMRCRCHKSRRRSRFSQLGTQIRGKRTDLCDSVLVGDQMGFRREGDRSLKRLSSAAWIADRLPPFLF